MHTHIHMHRQTWQITKATLTWEDHGVPLKTQLCLDGFGISPWTTPYGAKLPFVGRPRILYSAINTTIPTIPASNVAMLWEEKHFGFKLIKQKGAWMGLEDHDPLVELSHGFTNSSLGKPPTLGFLGTCRKLLRSFVHQQTSLVC